MNRCLGIGPMTRESEESLRLSPIMKYSPAGSAPAGRPAAWTIRRGKVVTSWSTFGSHGSAKGLAVDVDLAVPAGDGLTGQADDPLDQVLDAGRGVVGRLLEDDDVAPVDAVQVVAELVDQDPVVRP